MAKKSRAECNYTPGKLKTGVEGYGAGFPKKTPFAKEYGPHKAPGANPPSATRPSGSGESQIVGKFKRGK